MKVCPRWYDALTLPINPDFVTTSKLEALESKVQVTSYKTLFVHITKVRRKTTWEKKLPSKMEMEKNMKVNISHHHMTPTPRSDLR